MEEIKEKLKKREKQLLKLKKDKEKALRNVPEGSLRVNVNGNRVQYYQRTDSKDLNGIYIREKDHRLVQKLAQKDYDKRILCAAEQEMKAIQKYFSANPKKHVEEIYESLHIQRQKLVLPIKASDEEYVRNWENVEYEGKRFYEDTPELYTARGERVRSKSEVIIADLLNKEGIPYRYEYPLELSKFGVIYPDFTVMKIRERKVLYWEHLGMMDEPYYAENAVQKIITYGQNGIVQGKHLILSYETKMKPLDQRQILLLIRELLK